MAIYHSDYVGITEVEPFIFVIKFYKKEPDRKLFEGYLNAMEQIYLNYSGVVFIFDATEATYLSSEFRIRQGEWLIQKEALLQAKCKGHIYVITNIIMNMMLKGIFMVKKTPIQHKVMSAMNAALIEARLWI
jgi:hypothetical protein